MIESGWGVTVYEGVESSLRKSHLNDTSLMGRSQPFKGVGL